MPGRGTLEDFVVIGAGLPRTGTLSARAALEHLLDGPCYHGSTPLDERKDHMDGWIQVLTRNKLEPSMAKRLLAGYKAGVDFPVFCFYKELLEMNPGAKVLLTVRDPQGWYASAALLHTIHNTICKTPPYPWFLSLVGLGDVADYMRSHRNLPEGLNGRMNRAIRAGEEEAVNFYNQHVAEVVAAVPADQLLVFHVKDGWGPLCKFLNLPIPTTVFPNVNDKKDVLRLFNMIRTVTWSIIIGVPVLLGLMFPYCDSFFHLLLLTGLSLAILRGAGIFCQKIARKQLDKGRRK